MYLSSLEGVKEVHDLHIWAMSTTEIALTLHIVQTTIQIEDIKDNNRNQNQF